MPAYTTSMTQRSQITVPAQIRRALGLKPRDKVTFDLTDGVVTIRPASPSLLALAGTVPAFPGYDPRLVDQYIDEANEAHAEAVIAEMGR